MIITFIYISLPLFMAIMYKNNLHSSIYNNLTEFCNNWNKLNAYISESEPNKIKSAYKTCKTISTICYNNLIQYLTSSVTKINRKLYKVDYIIEGKPYSLLVNVKRGPNDITFVNENDENISNQVLPYYGPNRDWHNHFLSASFFDCNKIIVYKNNMKIAEFTNEEDILFNL